MQVNPILSAVLSGPWLIEQQTANTLLPVLDQLLMGQTVNFSEEKPNSFFNIIASQNGQTASFDSFDEAPEGSVAVINLSGVMMRQDSCYYYGTETIAAVTKAAAQHPNIAAIVTVVASGGGSVDGTEAYAQVLTASEKPLVTYVKGIMASAAYWVGSQAQHIMLEGRTTIVGSIGTQIELTDRKEMYKRAGIQRHLIRATESTQKNEDYEQALEGNYEPIRVSMLDPLNSVFLSEVRTARAGKLDEENYPLNGQILIGQAAIDAGLADSFGTLEDAVELALELAKDLSEEQKLNNDMNLFGTKKFAALAALAAAEAITAEQLTAANTELEGANITGVTLVSAEELVTLREAVSSLEAAQTENVQLREQNEDAVARITALEADLEERDQRITALGNQPGAMPTVPVAEGNELEEPKTTKVIDEEAEAIAKFKPVQ